MWVKEYFHVIKNVLKIIGLLNTFKRNVTSLFTESVLFAFILNKYLLRYNISQSIVF